VREMEPPAPAGLPLARISPPCPRGDPHEAASRKGVEEGIAFASRRPDRPATTSTSNRDSARCRRRRARRFFTWHRAPPNATRKFVATLFSHNNSHLNKKERNSQVAYQLWYKVLWRKRISDSKQDILDNFEREFRHNLIQKEVWMNKIKIASGRYKKRI